MRPKLRMYFLGCLMGPARDGHVLKKAFLLLPLLAFPLHLTLAQTDFTRVFGPVDRDVKVPAATGSFGHVDATALAELVDHIKAVQSSAWHDMSGTGKITYPLGDSSEVDDAVLTVLNADSYRLNVTKTQGSQTIRTIGGHGVIVDGDGKKQFLLPATAAQGFLAFPQLRVSTFPSSQTSVYDKGMLAVDGKTLHRVSIEHPLGNASAASSSAKGAHAPVGIVTDFYFDPVSHLLIESVASIKLSGLRSEFLQCITYGDYRSVDGSLVPFRFEQSLNGQIQWTLQLDTIELNSGVKQTFFTL
jgi:hypothetical protein